MAARRLPKGSLRRVEGLVHKLMILSREDPAAFKVIDGLIRHMEQMIETRRPPRPPGSVTQLATFRPRAAQ